MAAVVISLFVAIATATGSSNTDQAADAAVASATVVTAAADTEAPAAKRTRYGWDEIRDMISDVCR